MIKQVTSKSELRQFVHFPHRLYADDPAYVPQLNFQQMAFLGPKNPFFKQAEVAYFMAFDERKTAGRIAAIFNINHLKKYDDHTGFFGFFETVPKDRIAFELLDAATNWLKKRSIRHVIGPENFSANDSCGLLVDGFEEPPTFYMPHNKPYYSTYLLEYGFNPVMDLYSFRYHIDEWVKTFHPTFLRIEQRLLAAGISVRSINFRNFKQEIQKLRVLYNIANDDNWGFLPLSEKAFYYMAKELKQLVEADSILIAEHAGKPVAYLVAVPDFNQALKSVKNGSLLPTGWWHLINWQKRVNRIRLMILGVLPEYRNRGIDGALYVHLFHYMRKRSIEYAEICYVMQDNQRLIQLLQHLNAQKTKTYQLMELYV